MRTGQFTEYQVVYLRGDFQQERRLSQCCACPKRPPVHVISQPRGMCKRPKTLCMKPVQHQSDDTKPCLAVLRCLRRKPTIMRGDPHPFMHVHVYTNAPAAGLLAGPSGSGLTLVRWGRLSVPSSVPLVMPSTNANLQHNSTKHVQEKTLAQRHLIRR
jgi:hypothetical protein